MEGKRVYGLGFGNVSSVSRFRGYWAYGLGFGNVSSVSRFWGIGLMV